MLKPRSTVVIAMILAAALTRLLPHPPNLTSIAAVALFGGATFADRRLAFLVPFAALLASDAILGFYPHPEFVYLSFGAIVAIGLALQSRRTLLPIAAAALGSSVLFFVVTNFGTWLTSGIYPHTLAGLSTCYVAAVPFFRNTLEGDLIYTAILFGGFALLERSFPALRDGAAQRPALAA